MGIQLKTHKILWGRSGNRCAICRNELIEDETETDDESVIGDEAHIVARKEDGPRGKSTLSPEDRDKYDNLMLLCRKHHKIIDDQPNKYTVEKLHNFKKEHEKWVKESLNPDIDKDDLAYASYIDELGAMADFENWENWTSSLVSHGQPSIFKSRLTRIEKIPNFIISRFWPNKYESLENAVFNFKSVLNDLIKAFYTYSQDPRDDSEDENYTIYTEKFYKIREWDQERYHALLRQFEYHVALVEDLTLELNRAANLIATRVRNYIYPQYREEKGKFLLTSGPYMDLSWKTHKVEYSKEEREQDHPYPGLRKFMTDRENRDLNYGKGEKYLSTYFPGNFEAYEMEEESR